MATEINSSNSVPQLMILLYKNTLITAVLVIITYGCVLARSGSLLIELFIFSIAIWGLVKAAVNFTHVSEEIGGRLGMSKLATGVLIVAIGTSAPEFFSSIGAAIQNQPDMVIGNILGTIVANSLLGIGCGVIVASKPLEVHKDVVGTQMSVFLTSVLLVIACLYDGNMTPLEGILLLIVLIAYLLHVFLSGDKDENQKGASDNSISFLLIFVLFFINLTFLFATGNFVVSALINTADLIGISSVKLSASILAVGTSIPEIATAIAFVIRKNADGLFGQIIGSNIFDLLGVLGSISLFTSLSMPENILSYLMVSIFLMFVIVHVIMNNRRINRIEGILLVSLFVIFTGQLLSI